MELITTAKNKIRSIANMLKTSERIDRLEQATFDQLDNAITRIYEMESQIDYLKKEVNRLESRVDHELEFQLDYLKRTEQRLDSRIDRVEEMDLSEAVSDAISDLDMSDYVDTDDIVDSVLAAIAERISEGATR